MTTRKKNKKDEPEASTAEEASTTEEFMALDTEFEVVADGADIIGVADIIATKRPMTATFLDARMFDSKIKPENPSILLIARLERPYPVTNSLGDYIDAAAGDLVGLYYKPGMRALINRGNTIVQIAHSGEKNVGKPEPMHTFSIGVKRGASSGVPMKPSVDARRRSSTAKTPFDSGNEIPF